MAVPPTLKRLVAIRHAEEQHSRTRLEQAIARLRRLDQAFNSAKERARMSRQDIALAIASRHYEDRIAGLAELAATDRASAVLAKKRISVEQEVTELRAAFLSKRIELRQAELLLERQSKLKALEASRNEQIAMEDWYRARLNAAQSHRRPDPHTCGPSKAALSPDLQEN